MRSCVAPAWAAPARRPLRVLRIAAPSPRPPIRLVSPPRRWPLRSAGLALISAAFGLGGALDGYYDVGTWGPMALVALLVGVAVIVGVPARPTPAGWALVGSLAALAGLSALSILWAESRPEAVQEAQRWALYAVLAGVAVLLVRRPADRHALLGGAAIAGALVVVGILVVLLLGDGPSLFFRNRLTRPLGYVNGEGAAVLAAAWPALALAERAGEARWRALGIAVAVGSLGLLLLTQSRGAILAFGISAAWVLVFVPGRQRRGWVLVTSVIAVVVASPALIAIYESTGTVDFEPDAGAVRLGAALLVVVAVVAGAAYAVLAPIVDARTGHAPELRRRGRVVLVALIVVAGLVGVGAGGNPVTRLSDQIQQFTTVNAGGPTGATRLLSGSSNRFDYWRVALREFGDAPLGGVGAGNYTSRYFRLRGTSEDVRQPHSLPLQELSELGIGGGLLVVLLFGTLLAASIRAGRAVGRGQAEPFVAIAAGGIVVAFLLQTSIDWLHLLPSVTGVALLAGAALLPRAPRYAGRLRIPIVLACVIVAIVTAASVVRTTLATNARESANAALPADPQRALELTQRASDLQGDDLDTLYVRARAWEAIGQLAGARAVLETAVRLEPTNFVPYALLGDLYERSGNDEAALAAYGRALRLNPRDTLLPQSFYPLQRKVVRARAAAQAPLIADAKALGLLQAREAAAQAAAAAAAAVGKDAP